MKMLMINPYQQVCTLNICQIIKNWTYLEKKKIKLRDLLKKFEILQELKSNFFLPETKIKTKYNCTDCFHI
jgi:hypothetical protein